MNLSEMIYEKSRHLPEDKAQEVIDFIDFLLCRTEQAARPAEILTPNAETKAAIEACRRGDVASFNTIDALMVDLNAED
jgi:hypothetical protein